MEMATGQLTYFYYNRRVQAYPAALTWLLGVETFPLRAANSLSSSQAAPLGWGTGAAPRPQLLSSHTTGVNIGFHIDPQLQRLQRKSEVDAVLWDISSVSDMANNAPESADPAAQLQP